MHLGDRLDRVRLRGAEVRRICFEQQVIIARDGKCRERRKSSQIGDAWMSRERGVGLVFQCPNRAGAHGKRLPEQGMSIVEAVPPVCRLVPALFVARADHEVRIGGAIRHPASVT
jgi:acetylornithine/succinyldiaminopimelate/putrescine aminotransferase